jgi:hypothetical protein
MTENMTHTAKFTAKAMVFIVSTETCFFWSVAMADLAKMLRVRCYARQQFKP